MQSPGQQYLDVLATAEYLGTTERHVRELVYTKRIPHFKLGPRKLRFSLDDLDAWMLANRQPVRRPLADLNLGDSA